MPAEAEEIETLHRAFREVASTAGLKEKDIPSKIYVDRRAWSVENGMLNASLKKQRKVFEAYYRDTLAALHKG
jgi:hypothetical protein